MLIHGKRGRSKRSSRPYHRGTEEFNLIFEVTSPYILRYTKYIPQGKLLWARKFAKVVLHWRIRKKRKSHENWKLSWKHQIWLKRPVHRPQWYCLSRRVLTVPILSTRAIIICISRIRQLWLDNTFSFGNTWVSADFNCRQSNGWMRKVNPKVW